MTKKDTCSKEQPLPEVSAEQESILFKPVISADEFLQSEDSVKVKRPANKFMIFRKNVKKQAQEEDFLWSSHMKTVTSIAASLWDKATESQKKIFEDIAAEVKQRHHARYPNYEYRPQKRHNEFKPYEYVKRVTSPTQSMKNDSEDSEQEQVRENNSLAAPPRKRQRREENPQQQPNQDDHTISTVTPDVTSNNITSFIDDPFYQNQLISIPDDVSTTMAHNPQVTPSSGDVEYQIPNQIMSSKNNAFFDDISTSEDSNSAYMTSTLNSSTLFTDFESFNSWPSNDHLYFDFLEGSIPFEGQNACAITAFSAFENYDLNAGIPKFQGSRISPEHFFLSHHQTHSANANLSSPNETVVPYVAGQSDMSQVLGHIEHQWHGIPYPSNLFLGNQPQDYFSEILSLGYNTA